MTRWRVPFLFALATLPVAGCALGERPSLAESPTVEGTKTGDAYIDAVLSRLDIINNAVFTAEYRTVALFGGQETTVRAVQTAADRHAVTIGNWRFITEGTSQQTCNIDTGECEEGIVNERVSDTLVFPEMIVGGDLAKRLRRDAPVKVGETTTFVQPMAGYNSTCVDVPVDGGTKEWCALDNGVIARYVAGDISIDLISYSPTPDESLFLTTRNG